MQNDPTSFWDEYARIQTSADRNTTIDSYSWGAEERLNCLLENPQKHTPVEVIRIERIGKATSRRERSQAAFRLAHQGDFTSGAPDLLRQLEARENLRLIRASISKRNWKMLQAVGIGHNTAEIASMQGGTQGGVRVKIYRLRHQLEVYKIAA